MLQLSSSDTNVNITQTYLPEYRKGRLKNFLNLTQRSQQLSQTSFLDRNIMLSFTQIKDQINSLQIFFNNRMKIHQEQLLSIAHSQIKKIQKETYKIIIKYSRLIQQKNVNNEIIDLKYEIKFYQQKACELAQQNKRLKNQIKNLKHDNSSTKIGENAATMALLKVSKKYLKQKLLRKKQFSSESFLRGIDSTKKAAQISNKHQLSTKIQQIQSSLFVDKNKKDVRLKGFYSQKKRQTQLQKTRKLRMCFNRLKTEQIDPEKQYHLPII